MTTFDSLDSFMKRWRGKTRLDPIRDWLVLCTLSAILFAGITVWNAWAFDTVAQGGVIGAPVTSTAPIFSQSSLDTIHTIFASRAAEEAKYRTGTYRYTDPSL